MTSSDITESEREGNAVTDAETGPQSKTGGIWQPTEQALKTAHNLITEIDIPLHIARYVVIKSENKQPCKSSEWLRWIIDDERKAKQELRKEQASATRRRSWYEVAD